ncbi:Calmodulin-binding transcription activator 4 [Spatholobus suberectus]|nr:Calmodulin-binding transcription activator 4 [Spatholobus suberectus]
MVPVSNQESSHWLNFNSNNAENSVFSLHQGVDGVKFPAYSSMVETQEINSDYYGTYFDQSRIGAPPDADSSLTIAQKQKFTIKAVSPEWGYATETTKVIIVGSFLCHPSDSAWACMLGDVEVSAEIIQDGVICCEAPSHLPGKVLSALLLETGSPAVKSESLNIVIRPIVATQCAQLKQKPLEVQKSCSYLLD